MQNFKSITAAMCIIVIVLNTAMFAAIRVVNYNVGEVGGSARLTALKTVLGAIGSENINGTARPLDVLCLEEQTSMATTTQSITDILNSIYGPNTYARSILDGSTTGAGRPGVIYNHGVVSLLEEKQVNLTSSSGAARSTMRYKFKLNGYDSNDAIFYAYVSHYKASDTSSDAARRNVEAGLVRADADALGPNIHIIYAGDLNLYRVSTEPAWTTLTASGNGQAFDPSNQAGEWHDNASFRRVHTQSPVTTATYGGQVTGGMDDRFDFLLISSALRDANGLGYIAGSYHTFGNNGTHTISGALSTGTGASAAVLAAIQGVSDHCPVVADYEVPAKMSVTVDPIPQVVTAGAAVKVRVTVDNVADACVPAAADGLVYTISTTGSVSGSASGTVLASQIGSTYYITLDTNQPGAHTGSLNITSSSRAVANGNFHQEIVYNVEADSIRGDFSHNGLLDVNDINLMFAALNTSDVSYDLNSDGVVDGADLTILVQEIFGTQFGDVNLDKKVDYMDLAVLTANWLNQDAGWETGDTNGDGKIDFIDFCRMAANFGK